MNARASGLHAQDQALAERCRANVPGAFEELYRLHAPRLFALAYRLVGGDEAEDLLQEIFMTAHRKLGQYRADSALGTWLFRLGTNVCLDYVRSRAGRFARMRETLDDEVDGGTTASGPVLGIVDRLDLERALRLLPVKARLVFILHDIEGLGHREIAEVTGVAEGTSKSQLHKARMRLREVLRPGGLSEATP
jgi:RNA polymerase sigma-70 factor (ECF subfamily)